MAGEQTTETQDLEHLDVGTVLAAWETWEFPPVERSREWYAVSGGIGLFMLLFALFTANFVFALIVIMFAVIMLMQDLKKPARIQACITTAGVVFGNEFYAFDEIKDFSISYNPPGVKYLYLTFNTSLRPMISIYLDESNPNKIREALLPYVFENLKREGESLTDTLRRVYKL